MQATMTDAEILQTLMRRHRLTAPQLASRLGVDRTTITRITSGRRGIGRQLAARIAAMLAESQQNHHPSEPTDLFQKDLPVFTRTVPRLEDLPDVLTAPEAAAVLRISSDALYKHLRAGHLPHFRIGRRVFVRKEDVARLIRGQIHVPA